MIKFCIIPKKLGDRHLVGLGLSQENINRLKKDDPIVFPCEEVGLEDGYCLICYDSKQFRDQKSTLSNKIRYVLLLDDEAIEILKSDNISYSHNNVDFIIIFGEINELTEKLRCRIGPETRVNINLPPTEKSMFSQNN
jgi:hypothetical protein